MKTLQKQTSLFTEEKLTYSQEDSHANHTAQQENDLGKKTSAISGHICSERFERLSQPSLWAKMFVASLIGMGEWSSKKCALTWKLVGTKYNRYYCQLVPSVRHIEEIESGSLDFGMLPTITASFGERGGNLNPQSNHDTEKAMRIAIPKLMGLLPTPKAIDGTNEGRNLTNGKSISFKTGVRYGISFPQMANNQMLPTPMAQSRQTTKEQTEQRQIKYGGKTRAMYLENFAAMGWLPTPIAGKWRDTGEEVKNQNYKQQNLTRTIAKDNPNWTGKNSQLNPQFVAEMMGFPTNWTELPFLNGEKNQSKDTEMP